MSDGMKGRRLLRSIIMPLTHGSNMQLIIFVLQVCGFVDDHQDDRPFGFEGQT